MRRTAALAAALLLAACAGREAPDGPPPESTLPALPEARTLPEPAPIEPGQAPPPGPYAPGFDAVHYDIRLALPDTGSFVRGRTTARIALRAPRSDTLALDLTGLAVSRVLADGREAAFEQAAGRVRIALPPGARPGDTLDIAVDYQGRPDDGLVIGRNVHGERAAFADNWPNRARYWFPSIDHPSDKATVAFTVEAPEGWRVIANGVRGDDEPSRAGAGTGAGAASAARLDGAVTAPAAGDARPAAPSERRRVWRWATDVPIPTYTMVVGGARMIVREIGPAACGAAPASPRADGCVEVSWWAFPQDTANAASVFRRADEMVDFYADLVAPFPYEKLAHVQSSTRFGGMENATAIFYSEQALAEGTLSEGTVAHETAHQWFGDAVTEASWHHLWLSEGFATYFGALFFEHADGEERFREMMEGNRRRYVQSDVVGEPIVNPEQDDLFELLNANNYPKGAWVLHMLRGMLGDDVFFDGIRRYYVEHEHGTALTEDLRRALEAASGRELGWFFDQWVFEPGYPQYRVEHEWDGAAGEVEVTVEQTQPAGWPTFRMPLTLEFETPDGAVRRTGRVDERSETLRFELPAEPTDVRLDPDGWVLKEVVR